MIQSRRHARTRGLVAATASVALLALAACGGGSGSDGKKADLPSLSGKKLEVAAVWSGAEQEVFKTVIAGFEKETGAKVTFTSTGDDIATVLNTKIKGNAAPDVAVLPQPGLLAKFAKSGDAKPLSDKTLEQVDANYAPIWKELGTSDGKAYGVAATASNKSTVWYNVPSFEQAGVTPPKTWDEFLAAAKTLGDSGVPVPVALGGADGWTLTDWFENVYLRVAGPDMYDQLTAHEIPWTDESVKTTLSTLAELWGNGDMIVGGNSGALQVAFPDSVTQVFSDEPEGAIVYEGDFVAGVISDSTNAVVGEDAQFFPFPSVNGSESSVVGGGDVAVALTDSDASMALLQYLATPEAAEIWAGLGGFISPNENVDSSVYPDDTTRQIAEALVGAGDNFRFDMSDQMPPAFGGTPGAGEWKILQDFLGDPTSVDATAQALEDAAAQAFGG